MHNEPINFADVSIKNIDGVMLDLDGTIYHYQNCHDAAITATHKKFGFGLSIVDFRKKYRNARNDVMQRLSPQGACRSRFFAFQQMAEEFNLPKSYEIAFDLDALYWSNFISSMRCDIGAWTFLQRCVLAKLPICIVTDMTVHIQVQKIKQLGLTGIIDILVTSEEVGVEKPDVRMFQTGVDKLDADPRRCLMLGDNLNKDVLGARKLGIQAHLISLGTHKYGL